MESKILKAPHNLLSTECEIVTDFSEANHIANELLVTIKDLSKFWRFWLGVSANQIGYTKRIVVIKNGWSSYLIMVNPEIVERRFPFLFPEKCFSVPGTYLVKRYLWSKVRYQDLNGEWHQKVFLGPSAIYQELDHLNGILISEVGNRIR